MNDFLILSSIFLPFGGAVLIAFLDKVPGIRNFIVLSVSILLFILVCTLYQANNLPIEYRLVLAEPIQGIQLAFHIEALGLLFALIASSLWIVTTLYSIAYMGANKEKNQTRFYVFFAIAIASTMGISFSANLFSLFLFYELLTLSTYPLVTHKGTEEAKQSGRIYLGVLLTTSIALQLTAIIWTWSITGTTDFSSDGLFSKHHSENIIIVIYLLFLFGVGKAAIMPFHRWLPAAMVAPTPVSALLHAVAVVKAGVFTILKLTVYIFGIEQLTDISLSEYLFLIPSFTILAASIIALRQDNLKKRLAYSTISQLSYVVLATLILTPVSIMAAAMHILVHAFGKITLFFAAGSIYTASKKTLVSQLDGIGKRMPLTMLAFTIGSLSMIGVPPAAGFISKWYMLQGALSIQNWIIILVMIISTLLNAAYFLPIVYVAFFRNETQAPVVEHGESPGLMIFSLMLTALVTLLLFFIPGYALSLSKLIGQ